jgi:hypothetical protein
MQIYGSTCFQQQLDACFLTIDGRMEECSPIPLRSCRSTRGCTLPRKRSLLIHMPWSFFAASINVIQHCTPPALPVALAFTVTGTCPVQKSAPIGPGRKRRQPSTQLSSKFSVTVSIGTGSRGLAILIDCGQRGAVVRG